MKVLIHDERSDGLDFLLESIVNHGYKAGIAKNGPEIINMLSDERYNVVLTNGGYGELDPDQHSQIKSSSAFIIGITGQQKRDEGMDSEVDLYLRRPFEVSKLWHAIDPDKTGGLI
jgi:DNA-binding response OmpR family regulator